MIGVLSCMPPPSGNSSAGTIGSLATLLYAAQARARSGEPEPEPEPGAGAGAEDRALTLLVLAAEQPDMGVSLYSQYARTLME